MQLLFRSFLFLASSVAAVAGNGSLLRGAADDNQHRALEECVTHIVDFEQFTAGRIPSDLGNGVGVSGASKVGGFPAMIFDTANPTGGDTDLFSSTLGMALILSEDGKTSEPNDAAKGGRMVFTFDPPVSEVVEIGLLDFDKRQSYISGVRTSGKVLGRTKIPEVADGEFQNLPLGLRNLNELSVNMRGGGAVTGLQLKYCVPTPKVERVNFKGHAKGDIPSDLGRGVRVSALANVGGHGAMIFNTKRPTGGDFDLAHPTLGKVLIISEDGNSDEPNDSAGGGTVTFNFNPPLVELLNIDVLDFEGNQNKLFGKRADGTKFKIFIPGGEDGEFQTVPIAESNVVELRVELKFSGAVVGMDVIYAEEA